MIQPAKSNRPVLLDERTIAIHFLAGVARAGLGDDAKRPQFRWDEAGAILGERREGGSRRSAIRLITSNGAALFTFAHYPNNALSTASKIFLWKN
jgi:hypothetical protein